MDFFNNGLENPFLSHKDSHVAAIRDAMMQKREILKSIDREIEQLVEKRKGIEEDLVHLGIVVSSHNHNHNRLPNEVLSRIFILVAQDYGPVRFPTPRLMDPPPQLAISHMCSHWRRVALHTFELWSNTHLTYPSRRNIVEAAYLRRWRRWLMRAGTLPVRLSIDFECSLLDSDEIPNVLQTILLPFRVKRLHLSLTYRDLVELSTFSEASLSDLMDLSLDLTLPDDELNINMDDPHHLITRLRSLAIYGDELDVWLGKLSPTFPWSQLQSLDLGFVADLQPLIEILHQTPNLQVLSLEIQKFQIDTLEGLTMPSLRDFCLTVSEDVEEGTDLNAILHSFTCPSLIKLTLHAYSSWTIESFEIIKRQYNMQGLEEIKVINFLPLSTSFILRNAPMLRTLSVRGADAILDDAAIIGISSGTLGQFLTNLCLSLTDCDANEVVHMVEARMKTVNALIENSRSWREDITIIKDVTVYTRAGRNEKRKSEGVIANAKLKEVGINIALK
ncbi:hypothetical protein F5887DRAFT_932199 [Amanita rubescens]|nr:hypothetical protein F5887DRAFT_932199 [Amanita rubescens]